jgi:hypothetical protein
MGKDIDFKGLRAPAKIPETDPASLPTRRFIRMPQIAEQMGETYVEAFDRDVG